MIGRLMLKAQGQQLLRRDIPWFQSAEAQSSFLTSAQLELVRLMNEPGLLADLLRDARETSDPRAEFNFPWSAATDPIPPSNECQLFPLLRFPSAFSVARWAHAAELILPHNGAPVTIESEAGEILELICASPGRTVHDLFEKCQGKMSRKCLVARLGELVRFGLVAARPPARDCGAPYGAIEPIPIALPHDPLAARRRHTGAIANSRATAGPCRPAASRPKPAHTAAPASKPSAPQCSRESAASSLYRRNPAPSGSIPPARARTGGAAALRTPPIALRWSAPCSCCGPCLRDSASGSSRWSPRGSGSSRSACSHRYP